MKLTISTALRRMAVQLSIVFFALALLFGCKPHDHASLSDEDMPVNKANDESDAPDVAKDKATVAAPLYVCPMHPHIQKHDPGECPICGMTLVKKTEAPPPSESSSQMPVKNDGSMSSDDASTQKILYYYDPMRPEKHFDKPGSSPFMDMPLIPKYAGSDKGPDNGIAVSAAIVQRLGIRTANPVRRDVSTAIRVPARVVADARGQARVQARVSGWIERLHVRAIGQQIAAGSVIAEMYSPELIQAQEEMLLGAETAGPAAERLRRFGIADVDILAVRRAGKASRRLPIRAEVGGVVTDLGVREGSSVTPDTLILDLSARSAVWIEAQLFQVQKISLGNSMRARFTLPGLPGPEWTSEAGTVVPIVDPVTQALVVRFSINDSGNLPLGTVLDGVIEGASRSGVMLVPVTAVIRTMQGDRVMVQRMKNRFAPMPVKIGQRYGNDLEIVEGVSLADRVVVSGQFLLDAEANLQSGLSRMYPDEMNAAKGLQP